MSAIANIKDNSYSPKFFMSQILSRFYEIKIKRKRKFNI